MEKAKPFSVALYNLTGVGLGYFLIKKYLRGGIHIVMTLALFAAAVLNHASRSPGVWLGILAAWWFWMFMDGWRQARKYEKNTASSVPAPGRVYKTILIAVVGIEILGIASYQLIGYLKFNAGVKAFEALEFSQAHQHFKSVSQYFQLSLHPNVIAAESYLGETELLIDAATHRTKNQHDGAAEAYELYLGKYPSSSAAAFVRQQTADTFQDWAAQYHTTGDFETSIRKYETALTQYAKNIDPAITTRKIVTVYFDWAQALRKEGRFEEALQKYEAVQKNYPTVSGASQIKTARAATYTEWIGALRANHEYTDSIDQCNVFSKEYPDLFGSAEMYQTTAAIYREWGEYERDSARFDSAVDKYTTLINSYAESQAADGIDEVTIAQTYIECGDFMQSQQKYINALDCYAKVQLATKDKELNITAKTGYDTALKNLSMDTGADGTQIILETKNLACMGQPANSPAVDFDKKEPGKGLSCDGMITLPKDLEAVSPNHFRYVITAETGLDTIQTCPYHGINKIGSATIIREVRWWKVRVYRTTTGVLRIEKKFTGDRPAACPETATFLLTELIQHYTGLEPDINVITAWLQQVIQ